MRKMKVEDPEHRCFLAESLTSTNLPAGQDMKRVGTGTGKPSSRDYQGFLSTESFLSATSFRETTRVLTDALSKARLTTS